jgi:hypothetical protein
VPSRRTERLVERGALPSQLRNNGPALIRSRPHTGGHRGRPCSVRYDCLMVCSTRQLSENWTAGSAGRRADGEPEQGAQANPEPVALGVDVEQQDAAGPHPGDAALHGRGGTRISLTAGEAGVQSTSLSTACRARAFRRRMALNSTPDETTASAYGHSDTVRRNSTFLRARAVMQSST